MIHYALNKSVLVCFSTVSKVLGQTLCHYPTITIQEMFYVCVCGLNTRSETG